LRDHEDRFFDKYYDDFLRYRYYLRPYSTIFYYAPGCSRKIMNAFVDFFYHIEYFDRCARIRSFYRSKKIQDPS